MNKEALKLAIQLRDTVSGYWTENEIPIIEKLIELLAQPAQKPVGKVTKITDNGFKCEFNQRLAAGTKLYTTPPQRTWVGLTPEDYDAMRPRVPYIVNDFTFADVSAIVEAKLKEKNT